MIATIYSFWQGLSEFKLRGVGRSEGGHLGCRLLLARPASLLLVLHLPRLNHQVECTLL